MPISDINEICRQVSFGNGDIAICTSRLESESFDSVMDFYPHDPRPVGSVSTPEELEAIRQRGGFSPVRLTFASVESLDVVLDYLNVIRGEMVGALGEPTNAAILPPVSE